MPHHRVVARLPGALRRAAVDGRVTSTAAALLLAPLQRFVAPVSLAELAALSADGIQADPLVVARKLWALSDGELAKSSLEFDHVWRTVEERVKVGFTHYPAAFRADRSVALLVYVACRRERPKVVLETGVADGISSFAILRALEANGLGTLHSIDVRGDVGGLVKGDERSRWRLHILPRGRRDALKRAFHEVPRGEVFFHDSNHSYHWQTSELKAAESWLLPGGLMMADDVDASQAFLHWCREQQRSPQLCIARSRIFAATRLSGSGVGE